MRITIAQINSTVGDIAGNVQRIKQAIDQAVADQAELIIFPECALSGYPLKDLVYQTSLHQAINTALESLTHYQPNLAIVLGYPKKTTRGCYNCAGWLHHGKIQYEYSKQALPNFACFDELRTFTPGPTPPTIIRLNNHTFALSICYDLWVDATMQNLITTPVDALINISASTYTTDKAAQRQSMMQATIKHHPYDLFYINAVGAQDQLIFDGKSCVLNNQGQIIEQLPSCQPCIRTIHWHPKQAPALPKKAIPSQPLAELHQALTLGIRDYVHKNSMQSVCIGISGGIDSALVATLAADALGPQHVTGIYMPSPYSLDQSGQAAATLCQNLGIKLIEESITPSFALLSEQLAPQQSTEHDVSVAQQNLQARLRGLILMYYSNVEQALLLATGNKSELATGYCTLYGDMCGALAPIGDLTKTQVYQLAKHLNHAKTRIPSWIITRAPSAELAPNQKDSDHLPPYTALDASLEKLLALQQDFDDQNGASLTQLDQQTLQKLRQNEHKRQQAPPVLRVSASSWNIDRRLPLTYDVNCTL